MSNFKQKAQEVYAQGVEERGNFTPSGTPLKIYQWWAKHSPNAPEHENFCHFWRVVVIWAPLMWAIHKVEDAAEKRSVQVAAGLAALALLAWLVFTVHSATIIFAVVCALVYAATGAFVGGYLATPQEEIDEEYRFNRPLLWPVFILTLPFALVGFGGVKLKRVWNDDWLDYIMFGFYGLGALWVLFMLGLGIYQNGWIFLLWLALGLVGLAAIVAGIVGLATYLSGRRKVRQREARVAENEAWNAYFRGEGPDPSKREVREPGRVAKFFSGVLDFLLLVGQIVRVKKWKICPMVEVPKTGDANAHSAQA